MFFIYDEHTHTQYMGKLVGYKYVIVFKGAFRGVRRAKEDAIKLADRLAHGSRNVFDKATIFECTKDGVPKVMYEVTTGHVKAAQKKMRFRVK